jgi:hypothetical protein
MDFGRRPDVSRPARCGQVSRHTFDTSSMSQVAQHQGGDLPRSRASEGLCSFRNGGISTGCRARELTFRGALLLPPWSRSDFSNFLNPGFNLLEAILDGRMRCVSVLQLME